jgi:hypothetical protein
MVYRDPLIHASLNESTLPNPGLSLCHRLLLVPLVVLYHLLKHLDMNITVTIPADQVALDPVVRALALHCGGLPLLR